MITRNRMGNLNNMYQGKARRVLCVCSAGMLRSPTVAWVLSNAPFNFNTRAVGLTKEYALIPIDEAMVFWADDVIVMDDQMERDIKNIINNSTWKDDIEPPNIFNWAIPDMYDFKNPDLIKIIEKRANEEYNRPGMIFADLDPMLECECLACGAKYFNSDTDTCPNCGAKTTEI